MKKKKKTIISNDIYKSKTEEDHNENVMKILIKYKIHKSDKANINYVFQLNTKGAPKLARKKKEKREPMYITESIEYGDKDFVDCMKAVIKGKLAEAYFESNGGTYIG